MELSQIMELQKKFDSMHFSTFKWDQSITEENLEILSFLMLAITGEIGEASNIVKKILRGDFSLEEKRDEIEQEVTDIFIYLLKIAYQMNIDLEQNYIKKLKENKERFIKYEKGQKYE